MPTLTPDEWLVILESRLQARQAAVLKRERYYAGDHPLAFATQKFREAFGDILEAFSDNWCELVVDAAAERLQIMGFRFGDAPDAGGAEAWRMWQVNGLDAESIKGHTDAIKHGVAYVLVDPTAPIGAIPRITVEHPSQFIIAHDKGNPLNRLAALKLWRDDYGIDHAMVFLPDRVVSYVSQLPGVNPATGATILGVVLPPSVTGDFIGGRWVYEGEQTHRMGAVCAAPLLNKPGMLNVQDGVSDLRPAMALNDAVNKFFSDMIIASEFAAYPQRVLTGIELPLVPGTNEVDTTAVQQMAGVQRTWLFEGDNSKATQFAAADLSNYVKAIETAIQHIAAQTRTPPHYLLGQMINLSADALKAAESGLVHRVRRKFIDFSDGWEEAFRMAFRQRGNTALGNVDDAEVIWKDPETQNPVVVAQAATQRRAVGVPLEVIWEELGYSPQQIADMKVLGGLPDRPPPGATTAQVPSPLGGVPGTTSTTPAGAATP